MIFKLSSFLSSYTLVPATSFNNSRRSGSFIRVSALTCPMLVTRRKDVTNLSLLHNVIRIGFGKTSTLQHVDNIRFAENKWEWHYLLISIPNVFPIKVVLIFFQTNGATKDHLIFLYLHKINSWTFQCYLTGKRPSRLSNTISTYADIVVVPGLSCKTCYIRYMEV